MGKRKKKEFDLNESFSKMNRSRKNRKRAKDAFRKQIEEWTEDWGEPE